MSKNKIDLRYQADKLAEALVAVIAAASTAAPVTEDKLIMRKDSDGSLKALELTSLEDYLGTALEAYFADVIHGHSAGNNQIDHGDLSGLSDNDHTQYIRHALATAVNDFLVASGSGTYVKKTLAETITILRTSLDSIYAAAANGVTNGNSHNHVGGDGAALSYGVPYGMYTNTTVPASTTHHGAPYKAGLDTNNVNWIAIEAGTFSLLTVRKASGAAQPASGTLTVTLYVNNVASALTVSFANADGSGGVTKVDNSNTVAVSAGDTLRWVVQNNATATSATLVGIEMLFTKSTT